MIQVTFDYQAETAYLYISNSPAESTLRVSRSTNVDLGADGSIVGIEFLDVTPELRKALLATVAKSTYHVNSDL